MMLQSELPLLPHGAKILSPKLAVARQGDKWVFFNAAGAIQQCRVDDRESVRLVVASLSQHKLGLASPEVLGKELGLGRTTAFECRRKFEQDGAEGVRLKKTGPHGAHTFKGAKVSRAQKYLNEGLSNRQVAAKVGVSEYAIRSALKAGRLHRPEPTGKDRTASSPRERSEEDARSEGGVAVKRHTDRGLARMGKLKEAPPEFAAAESVAGAGVLVALPALAGQGLYEVGERVYGALKNGYFGLVSMLTTLVFMALLRIKTVEQLASHAPGELGLLLGLDRAPEVKTVRRKLAEMGERGQALELSVGFAERWASRQPDTTGYLYVDGHVRAYNGRKHKLPKTLVQRRRLCMPATTDYWVNDANADPLFYVTGEAHEGLLKAMDEEILPSIRELVGPDRRVTLVFDREGWSPERFKRWKEDGFDVVTYRKGKYEPWPDKEFRKETGYVCGRQVGYRLAERIVEEQKGFFVREVRRLCDDGKQTSVVTTRDLISAVGVAEVMFCRWRQENFFKYMREDFALDLMPTTAVEPADPERMAPNPARKEKKKQLTKEQAKLKKLQEEYGRQAQGNDESKRRTMRGFKIANAELGKQIRDQQARVEELKVELSALPERVPVGSLLPPEEVVRLERERKRLTDSMKMVAYRAESELANLVAPLLGTHSDEARTFLKAVFQLKADLLPDVENNQLVVRLHGMANWRSNRVLAALCEVLNQQETRYPGTTLKLVLDAPEVR